MSHDLKKGSLFLKEVLKRIQGDQAEAVAAKITRKAISAFDAQIAGLNAKLVDAEDALENTQEAFTEAIYPKEVFTDNKSYCQSIVNAQEAVDSAQEDVDNIKASLEMFKTLLSKID